MIFTAPMKLLIAVVLDKDTESVTKELLRQSVLDFISLKEISRGWKTQVSSPAPLATVARTVELRKRAEGFFNLAQPPLKLPNLEIAEIPPVDLMESEKYLDSLAAEINGIRERQRVLQEEIIKLEEIRRQVDAFEDLKSGAAARSTYSFLSIQTGTVPVSRFSDLEKSLEAFPSVVIPSQDKEGLKVAVLLITMKRDDSRINTLLSQAGWEDVSLPVESPGNKGEALREITGKIEKLRKQQQECNQELAELLKGRETRLQNLWSGLRINELFLKIQSHFSRTERTILFSGWLPAEKQAEVEEGIKRASENRCYIEWMAPKKGEAAEVPVPVEMRNPKVLEPFEKLVRNYALPEYGSIDPTPFVAAAYLVMFGLMFGDAGHGLVLALVGLAGQYLAKKRRKSNTLFRLITYCGSAAIVTGILFGSYFGTALFPPLWFNYHGIIAGHGAEMTGLVRDIYDILGITIRFGITIIGLGLLLNWVNLIKKRDWLTLVLDKGGLLGGWIYGAGTWAAFYFVGHNYKELPPGNLLFWLLGLPTLVLALKGPLEFLRHNRVHISAGEDASSSPSQAVSKPSGKRINGFTIIDFFMEWIVEVLEIYSGYLANTLSFMRVAGLGIAHVSLMIAFFQIAEMMAGPGGYSLWSYIILILGNILVIGLEGLSAGIQSLRLNYYEFFSKYFNGTGRAYRPITLRSRD